MEAPGCVSCGISIDEGDLCEGCDKFLEARKRGAIQ